jgi:hypothetical protein
MGFRDSVVKTLRYKLEDRGFETRRGEWRFPIYVILLAALGPGVYSPLTEMITRDRNKNISMEQSAAGGWDWQSYGTCEPAV